MTSKLTEPESLLSELEKAERQPASHGNSTEQLSTTAGMSTPSLDRSGKLLQWASVLSSAVATSSRSQYPNLMKPGLDRSGSTYENLTKPSLDRSRKLPWWLVLLMGQDVPFPVEPNLSWVPSDLKKNVISLLAKSFKLSTSHSHRADPQPVPMKIVESEIKEADSLPSDPLPRPPEMNKLFLFFWHAYSPVMYSLYKIDVQIPPPTPSAIQDSSKPLSPILELKTGKYPDGMCCVQLGSVLYFMGGEMNIDNPYIAKDVKELHEKLELDVFPQDVYYFELAIDHNYAGELKAGTRMNSGKARPLAFVANEKIYVIGSTDQDLDENFAYFEMYDPKFDSWIILPNPPIRNVNTIWVGHVVVGRKALIVAWQQEKKRLYCFDFDTREWANTSIPDYPGNFSGNTEFVGNTLYGCYYNTIAAIAPLKEDDVEAEEKEPQQLFKHHCLHQVSKEMDMDAILNVRPQVQYSSRLLHLRNMYFCYVRTGMPPHPDPDLASDLVIGDDKKRFISIVIFQAGKTYKKDDTRFFKADFLHSEHYEVKTPFPNEGFIKGCCVLGSGYLESSKQIGV